MTVANGPVPIAGSFLKCESAVGINVPTTADESTPANIESPIIGAMLPSLSHKKAKAVIEIERTKPIISTTRNSLNKNRLIFTFSKLKDRTSMVWVCAPTAALI